MAWEGRQIGTVCVGAAFGAGTSFMNGLSSPYVGLGSHLKGTFWQRAAEVASLMLDAGWCWAALAVAVGWWSARTLLRAVAAAPIALVAATTAYFVVDAILRGESMSVIEIAIWSFAGLLLGPVLGVVGHGVRQPGLRGLGAALVVPLGATLQMVLLPPGIVRIPGQGVIPNPEADLARFLVLLLAATATAVALVRAVVRRPAALREVSGAPDARP